MKTRIGILMTLIASASILLAACSSISTVTPTLVSEQELDLAPELAVGILKLEDTDQAVTSEQAVDLLTYWQAYQALSSEETTAQAELEALVGQIQGVLTDDQWQAVQAMELTSQSVAEMSQSLAAELEIDSVSSTEAGSDSGQSFPGAPGEMGGGPGGVISEDMSIIMGGDGMEMSAQDASDAAATPQTGVQNAQVTTVLLNALIELMESRI